MKKSTIKAFTLVEMLIVIVIIGILIASLMPRMQSAQGRARDVARKNDLSQIQTAIITSQQDKGDWPEKTSAEDGMAIDGTIVEKLQNAGMTQVPTDPNGSNIVKGLGVDTDGVKSLTAGKYGYMVTTRNSVTDGGFVLMAKTEVEGSSNWIVCDTCSATASTDADNLKKCGIFKKAVDLKNVKTCSKFKKNTDSKCQMTDNEEATLEKDTCYYTDEGQLAYILVY